MAKRKYFTLFFLALTASCSTAYKNEHQHYLGIKAAMAKDQYSLAVKEVMIFKENYPNSDYLCEILPIEIAWRKDRGYEVKSNERDYFVKCRK